MAKKKKTPAQLDHEIAAALRPSTTHKSGPKHHARMKAPKKSAAELFVRFGTWHPSERSRNYARGGNEDGVSVYDVVWNERAKRWNVKMPPESDNPWGPEDTFWKLLKEAETGADPIFIVRGDVVGVGHDGEPLIRHINVLHKIAARDVMSTDLSWQGDFRSDRT